MRSTIGRLLQALLGTALSAAVGVVPVWRAEAIESAAPPACDVTGRWQTDWGGVTLKQSGSRVTGSFATSDGDGRIDASISGTQITGSWKDPASSGQFVMTLRGSCASGSGTWGKGQSNSKEKWGWEDGPGKKLTSAPAAPMSNPGTPFQSATSQPTVATTQPSGAATAGAGKGRWILTEVRIKDEKLCPDWSQNYPNCYVIKGQPGNLAVRTEEISGDKGKHRVATEYQFQWPIPPSELVPGAPLSMTLTVSRLDYTTELSEHGRLSAAFSQSGQGNVRIAEIELGGTADKPSRTQTGTQAVPAPADKPGSSGDGYRMEIVVDVWPPPLVRHYRYLYTYRPPGDATPSTVSTSVPAATPIATPTAVPTTAPGAGDNIIGLWRRERDGRVFKIEGSGGKYRATIAVLGADDGRGWIIGELVSEATWNPKTGAYPRRKKGRYPDGGVEWSEGSYKMPNADVIESDVGDRLKRVR